MAEARRLGLPRITELLPIESNVYVSPDFDPLDLSVVPGCALSEPDGPTFRQLMESLRVIPQRHRVHSFDFVQANPPVEVATGAAAYIVALVIAG